MADFPAKTPEPIIEDLSAPEKEIGSFVKLKEGGQGYKFNGEKYATRVFPDLESATKRWKIANEGRMAAAKSQNRMPPLKYYPEIVQVPNGDGFLVIESGLMHKYGLKPYKK